MLVLRVSRRAQERIEDLLQKQKLTSLTPEEELELDQQEDIDDYLSYLNRLIRNLAAAQSDIEENRAA